MPGTIMDDNRAKSKVLTENLCFEKSGRCGKSAGLTAINGRLNFSIKRPLNIRRKVPKFIALLVIAASVGLAERVDAACVNLDCSDLKYFRCQNTSMPPHSDILSDNMYIEKSRQYLMSGLGNWYGHYNTGDYLDIRWYYYLDKGQYYYLDDIQYKLLSGSNYSLWHSFYPKLFEIISDQGVGFRDIIGMNWVTFYQMGRYTPASPLVDNLCSSYDGPIPVCRYCGWLSGLNTGDWIDKRKYIYLDEIRYKILDETQYKWLGGLAYKFKTFGWYSDIFHYTHDSYHNSVPYCSVTASSVSTNTIPEPATIGFLGLGGTGLLIFRNKKSRTNQA